MFPLRIIQFKYEIQLLTTSFSVYVEDIISFIRSGSCNGAAELDLDVDDVLSM
jgi:hypothetical protein